MASMDITRYWFRSRVWELIDDCYFCNLKECPNWCREFTSCQIDELCDQLEDKLAQRMRADSKE